VRRGSYETPTDARRAMSRALPILFKRIKRRFNWQKLEYLVVVERHKSGWPHLHVLLRCPFLAQRWISAQGDGIPGSPVVDIRQVKNARQAARYVAKYIGKEPAQFGTSKRYWCSQGWDTGKAERVEKRLEWAHERWLPREQTFRELVHQHWANGW